MNNGNESVNRGSCVNADEPGSSGHRVKLTFFGMYACCETAIHNAMQLRLASARHVPIRSTRPFGLSVKSVICVGYANPMTRRCSSDEKPVHDCFNKVIQLIISNIGNKIFLIKYSEI